MLSEYKISCSNGILLYTEGFALSVQQISFYLFSVRKPELEKLNTILSCRDLKSDFMEDVYHLALSRLKYILKEFDQVYISFSGGKDSGVLLNLYMEILQKYHSKIRPTIFYIDYEICYQQTAEYVNNVFTRYKDVADIYHICVSFKVSTCTSMFQTYWRPWDEEKQGQWVREMPEGCYRKEDFDFYTEDMWDYDFQFLFAQWLHDRNKSKRTACLVGIRTQESYNRWRAIYNGNKYGTYNGKQWSSYCFENIYNFYPLYDWKTSDIWVANGRFGWEYNKLYDLYYQAGVPLSVQRVASPFLSEARESLQLYKAIDPDTWGKMLNRVNGVNFTALYGGTHAMGRRKVFKPEHFTWERYMRFLFDTLPYDVKRMYEEKLKVSISFWKNKGGALSEEVIRKLAKLKIPITVVLSPYRTSKMAVKMEYLDDIDIAEHREIPTYRRVCTCILRNDYQCKYMGFAQSKDDRIRKMKVMMEYEHFKSYYRDE